MRSVVVLEVLCCSLLVHGIWNEALRDGISCYADVSIQNRSILQNVVVVAVLYMEFQFFCPLSQLSFYVCHEILRKYFWSYYKT